MRWRRYAFLAAAPFVPLLQARIEPALAPPGQEFEEVLAVWSGDSLRKLCPGLEDVMADLYWLRTIQYYGGQRVFTTNRKFELLEPLTRVTTTLDPQFEVAYRYGATFLSEPVPVGAGRPLEGAALLERGVRNLPDSWRLRQDLGAFYFFFLKDAKKGAAVLLEASERPGAPFFLKTLGADMLSQAGDRAVARALWKTMYDQAEEGPMKGNARHQLLYLDALDELDALNALVKEHEGRTGHRASALADLLASGILRSVPVDPSGTPFAYDPETGELSLSPKSVLWRRVA